MSDVLELAAKAKESAEWRGETSVERNGEVLDVAYRQLFDQEQTRVKALIDITALAAVQEAIPDDLREELEELQEIPEDERTDEQEERFVEVVKEMNEYEKEADIDEEDFSKALRYAAKKGITPDKQDVEQAFSDPDLLQELEQEYNGGETIREPDDLYDPDKEGPGAGEPGPLKDYLQDVVVEGSMDGDAKQLGMTVIEESLPDPDEDDEEGN